MSESCGESEGAPVVCVLARALGLEKDKNTAVMSASDRILTSTLSTEIRCAV